MASSVSSERAFSSAGITLSKRCNRLQADIVEALQFMKCLFLRDLIFWEVRTTTEEETDLKNIELNGGEEAGDGEPSWEELLMESHDIPESDTEA